ncbi:MAG: YHS domain-containing protein [Chloroflexi bacterium]|nr:YHS domain-containing protein [Chloroflexota bacterium]
MWPFSKTKLENDPVCGMDVDARAALLQFHKGTTYYFCSASCRASFQKDADKYAANPAGSSPVREEEATHAGS